VLVRRTGGPEVLELTERADPRPGQHGLLVDLAAAGVNYMDIYQRTGSAGYTPELPFVPGAEGAGTVLAVGEGARDVDVGDRVAWTGVPGSYADRVVVPAERAVPVPDDVDLTDAAAVLLQGLTAHYLSHSTYPVRQGDLAVVHAAAGGVGQLLTQLVASRGGIVVATASTEDKRRLSHSLGARYAVDYPDFPAAVADATGGVGANVVYDGVGKATFDAGLQALRPRGLMVLYGAASGPVPPFDLQRLNAAGSLYVTRPTLAHYVADREELLERADDLFGWLADGSLRVQVGGRYPLAEAARAHADLAARRTTGKLLLVP
jgi:NADPH2:quinone reductase